MKPGLFILISIFIVACGSKKSGGGPVVDIAPDKVTINNNDIGKIWKLNTVLESIGGTPREVKLNSSSYFIFDDLGMVVYERSSVFEPTERGYADGFNIFFDTAPEKNDWPKKPFTGKLTIGGKHINDKFKFSDLSNFDSGWIRSNSVGSEKLENRFFKIYFTFSGEELSYLNVAAKD